MTRRLIGVLMGLTVLSFVIVQGMHLAIDSAWSWFTGVTYAVILAFQVVAFCQTQRPAR